MVSHASRAHVFISIEFVCHDKAASEPPSVLLRESGIETKVCVQANRQRNEFLELEGAVQGKENCKIFNWIGSIYP